MTFLNASLLLAVAAISIPVVMHLISRKEPRQVLFPSVRLLTQRFETNRTKMRVRRWWLLALRMAALAAVALTLARPAISGDLSLTWTTIAIVAALGVGLLAMATVAATKGDRKQLMWSLVSGAAVALLIAIGWGTYTLASGERPAIDDQSPVALVIVIDNGPLSGWKTPDDDRLDRIRDAAKQLVAAAGSQSRIAIIDLSSTPASFALDVAGAISKINQLAPLESFQPIASRIEASVRLLETSEITSRQLVVLTGLTESSFPAANVQSIEPLLTSSGVSLTVWDLDAHQGVNRSLSLTTLSDESPAPDSAVTVAAKLSIQDDLGETTPTTVECVLFPADPSLPVVRNGEIVRPDAKPVDRLSVQLSPGREFEIQMRLPPLPIGLHQGAFRLVGTDALAIDDISYFTVAVLPQSRLLVVGDQVEEAYELSRAITVPAEVDDPAAQYAIERIGYDDLAVARIQDFEGVLLMDPPASALAEPELERYLDASGGVLVLAGKRLGNAKVDIDGFPLFERPWRATSPGTFLEISSASHPTMAVLANVEGGVPFADFRVNRYWQTQPREGDQVLMRFAGTDHPALIETASGDSARRLLVLTTPLPELADPADAWNELFSGDLPWPAFLLVRDLTRYVTRRSAESWTTNVGFPVTINLQQRDQKADDEAQRRLQWFPPVGVTPIPVDVPRSEDGEQARRVVLGRPKNSGVHWIRGDRPGLGFTVNLPRESLRTDRIETSLLDALFGSEGYRQIQSVDDMDWTSGSGEKVLPLWSPMMLLALIVFLLEQVLGNRFYRQPTAGRQPPTIRRAAA